MANKKKKSKKQKAKRATKRKTKAKTKGTKSTSSSGRVTVRRYEVEQHTRARPRRRKK